MSKTLIIVNPHAGSGRAWRVWRELESTLWQRLGDLIVVITKNPAEVTHHITEAYNVGVRQVISIGGDGTNHALVNTLVAFNRQQASGDPMIYGNIAIGTGHDFARGQNIPVRDLKEITDWIVRAEPKPTDIGMLTTGNTREYFLNIASAGIGGDVAQRVNRRKIRRPWTFLQSTINAIVSHRPQPLEVTLDGKAWYEGRAYAVAVANGTTFGRGMKIAPDARIADGLFDVVLIKGVSRLTVLAALKRVYDGTHLTHPAVMSARAAEVFIHSPRGNIDMELDGEFASGQDVTFSVQPGQLQMLL